MPGRSHQSVNPRPNLYQLGFERMAQILLSRLASKRGKHYCYVLPNGKTLLQASAEKRGRLPPDDALIGAYTNETPPEVIEGDLLQTIKERSQGE